MTKPPLVGRDAIGNGRRIAAEQANPDAKDEVEVSAIQNARGHESALIAARMGPLGRLIGSEDAALTIVSAVIAMCFASLLVASLVSIWNASIPVQLPVI